MAKDFSAVFGKKTAQEEEDRRRAEEEKKRAQEAERARLAEEKRKAAEEAARKKKEAEAIGAKDAERLSQNSEKKNYTAPAQKAAIERSENMAERTAGDYSSKTAVKNRRQERQKALNENIKNVYEGMDKQLRQGIYDNALDNQSAAMAAEWIYSPGAAIAEYATGIGEALKAKDKQYISPSAAARYNIGGNIGERAGADEQREFSSGETVEEKAPEWRENLGERITEAYKDNAALEYKKHAEEQKALANEQTENPIGKVALGLAGAINSMAVAGAYSTVTGVPISSYMAFTGGADKTADYIEAGYSPISALGAGIAWGKVLKELEGSSSFGHISGGLVDTAAKKIGDSAVRLAGQFIDGKTVAAVVDIAKGPIVKRLLGGLSEGAEEMAEYGLEYVFDSILGREDVSFDVKEFFYSGLIGALAGELFEFSNAVNLPAEIAYHFSEEGKAERAAEIKEYLDSVDPRILESVAAGDLDAVEETMKSIPAKQFEKPESFIENGEERAAVAETQQNPGETASETQQGLFGPEIYSRIFGVEDPKIQAQMDEVSEIGNRLGIDVAFSRDIISDGLHTADGRIYINPDAKNPLRQVLVHELTHEIESSGFYGNLSETILDYAQRVHGVELESMRRGIREDYSIIGQKIETAEDADKEIVAKFAEQYLFRDENSINRLCNTNPNLFQRIRYWISDMIVKFRGTSEEQFLRNAEKLYARAWATRGEIQGAGVEQADIVELDNGDVFVRAGSNRNVITGKTVNDMRKDITNFFDQLLNKKPSIDITTMEGDVLTITKRETAKKARDNYKTIHGKPTKMTLSEFKVKLRAEAHIDEIAEVSKGSNNALSPDTKNHSFATKGLEYRTAYFQDYDGQYYEITFSIGHDGTTATVYNVGRMKKSVPPSAKIVAVRGSKAHGGSLSNNSISQNSGNVNGQNNAQNNTPAFGRSYEEMLNTQNLSTEQAEATPSMKRADGGKTAEDWKNIAERINSEHKGIWRMKDFSRVLDQASGNDKGLRQQLYELYEKPLNEAQGSYAKKYAEKAKQITAKFKELGIKAKSNESKAVQRIGEGVKEINKGGETVEYTIDDLKKDFPDSWQQIKEGADFCREVYDEFLHDLNAMYESIYPATVEQARERISSYDKGILRDESKIEHFRGVTENLEAEKAEKQTQLSGKKPTTLIYAQIQSQIDNIDARIAKAERIIGRFQNRELVKKISRETLNAQIENGEILRNKQIKPRKDYFRHFQELTNEFAEIADIFSNDQRIPPNLAGKSADTKPRTIWTSIAQRRAGENYYTEDAVGGLLQYTEIAEKLLAFDPLISHFRDVNSAIRAAAEMADNEVKGKGTNAGQFAAYADKLTNKIAGKSDTIDRWLSDEWGANGRAIMKAVEVINRRVKSNAILGNFRSAIVQIGNLPNASLYIQNPADWAKGAVTLLNGLGKDENIRNARAQSNFMNRRYMGDAIDKLTKEIQSNNILDKPKEFALWMLGAGDRFGAELIWHTAYTKALNNPEVLEGRERGRAYESAIDYADDITRRSVGGRAEGDVPLHMDSKWYSLIAPFQIEVANTFNAAKEAFGDKNWVGLAAFEISVFLMNCLLEGITGDRPLGLDFIRAAVDVWMEATGADDEEEEEKDFWDIATYAAGRFGGELLSGMPLGTQIGSFVTGGDEQKAEAWFGDSDPTRYGTGNIGMGAIADAAEYFIDGETPKKLFELATDGHKNSYEEWSVPVLETVDTFAPVALPWGGKQLSRTLQGADQIIRGGAYGTEANGTEYLKFLQGKDLDDFYKTLLFGRYASDAGQEYIDSGFSTSLSGKQTEQMKMAEYFGVANEEFYSAMMELRRYNTKAAKQEALFALDVSENAKNVIDGILWGGMTYKDETPQSTRDYSSAEAFYTSGLMAKDFRLHELGYSESEIADINKALKKSGTKAGDIENLANALGITEAEAFELYQRRNGDWIENAEDLSEEEAARASGAADFYGMSTEDYIAVLNLSNLGTLVDGEYKTSAKYVIPKIAEILNVDTETATDMYRKVHSFDYSRADLEESQIEALDIAQNRYGVDDYGYFVAKNAAFIAEGEKDEWGNTVEGSAKAEAIANIAKQLGIDESEATIYYLAAEGELILSVEELTSSHREDLAEAKKYGWTEMQYINAVNVLKVAGASKKDEIIKALMDAGASYAMAQGYYNLRQNKDYDRYVGKTTVAYGMSTQKQADKVDYFVGNYNSDGNVSASDVSKWVKATKGIRKKAEYISACMDAGATYQQAVTLYALMMGHDDNFNAWYKENGG